MEPIMPKTPGETPMPSRKRPLENAPQSPTPVKKLKGKRQVAGLGRRPVLEARGVQAGDHPSPSPSKTNRWTRQS